MNNQVFINKAFDEAFKSYLANKDLNEKVEFNKFIVVVIRLLVLIYGEEK